MLIPDDKRPLFAYAPFRPSVAWELGLPQSGALVTASTIERSGPRVLPFKVSFRSGVWINATTGEALECEIRGWRL